MDKDNVDTLEQHPEDDDKNTDTTLEQEDENQQEPDTDTQSEGEGEGSDASDDGPSTEDLATLNDDQFKEYVESGKLPEGFKKSGNKDSNDVDTRTDTSPSGSNKIDRSGQDSNSSKDSRPAKSPNETTGGTDKDGGKPTGKESGKNEGNNARPSVHKQKDSSKDATNQPPEGHKPATSEKNIDYKNVYDTIFKGFKANGKEIVPKTVEDVVALMQMGANYTKKMQSIAPLRRTVESLNRADIGDEDLNFLIDLHKGDKEAIKKLLQKHKVDPIELDLDSTNYVPKNNMISDEDTEYFDALDDIKPSIPKIKEILDSRWDSKSKAALLKDPEKMRQLHEEIQMGRFDVVQERLEHEKTFGRYKGKSDLEAYTDVLNMLAAEYNEAEKRKATAPGTKPSNTPKREIPDKKGAAPNKAGKPATQSPTLSAKDIFAMSDEEFEKLTL